MTRAFRRIRNAFTLVELLVVITIIAALLSMLVPALDQAVYQAQLAVCGAHQDAMIMGVLQYAMGHKRSYPYKIQVHHQQYWSVMRYQTHGGNSKWYGDQTQANTDPATPSGGGYDYRPMIKDYYDYNKLWNDPLAGKVDYRPEANDWDAAVLSAYQTVDGWQYYEAGSAKKNAHGPGMTKIGNRMVMKERRDGKLVEHSFNLLIADAFSYNSLPDGVSITGHPDREGGSFELSNRQNLGLGPAGAPTGAASWKGTYSHYNYFNVLTRPWGTLDMNFGMQDGSVRRIAGLPGPYPGPPYYDADYPLVGVPGHNEVDTVNNSIGAIRDYLLKD